MKNKRRPLKGARKFRIEQMPWKTIALTISAAVIGVVLIVQFVSLEYNKKKITQTIIDNLQLNDTISSLTQDLSSEREDFENFITEQLENNVTLQDKIDVKQSEIDEKDLALLSTQEENTALLNNLAAAQLQNDTLRRKLDTMLGNTSRNGEELSPLPTGPSGLTVNELKKLTAGTALAGIEDALLEIEEQYNVNALYALAVAKLETGSGTSFLVKEYNNLFAMRGRDGWFHYGTKAESVHAFGKLMVNNYFSKGFLTLETIGPRYAEGSHTWALKAKYHMITDMRKLH